MNKNDGLVLLNNWHLPTLELLTISDLKKNPSLLANGISVRLFSKESDLVDVFLPSIHNVHDINTVIEFLSAYKNKYDIIIHQTVKPNIIGTISKFNNGVRDIMSVELYNNFQERSHKIIASRVILEMLGNMTVSVNYDNFPSKSLLLELMSYVKNIELDDYTIEFVLENNKLIFTDLYSNSYNKFFRK